MTNDHPGDEAIQQFVLDPSHVDATTMAHIGSCGDCQTKAATYQWLITGIREQERPAFAANLAEQVLAQLPPPRARFAITRTFASLVVLCIVLVCGICIYIFRGSLATLYNGISPLVLYLMITIAGTFLMAQGIDLWKNYQKKIDTLDLS